MQQSLTFISLSSYLLSSYGVVECIEREKLSRSFFVARKDNQWVDLIVGK